MLQFVIVTTQRVLDEIFNEFHIFGGRDPAAIVARFGRVRSRLAFFLVFSCN